MRKKLVAMMLSLALAVSVTACGGNEAATETAEVTEQTEVTEETVETEEEEPVEEVEEEEPAEEEKEEPKSLMGFNMIDNGDFAAGRADSWFTYCEGGYGTVEANADGQMEVKIAKIGTKEHGVQVYYDGFGLEQGCVYEMYGAMDTKNSSSGKV